MAITGTMTNLQICKQALRKLGILSIDEEATADDMDHAINALDRLLKGWQNRGYAIWCVTSETVTATTDRTFALTAGRPLDIHSIRLNRSGIETPMLRMDRREYDDLPQKGSTGLPTRFYFDRQRDTGTVYVWPVLSTVTDETFEVTYVREIEDAEPEAQVDAPTEWYEAVVYGLAARLADDYNVSAQNIMMRAEEELRIAEGADREGSVFFIGSDYADA